MKKPFWQSTSGIIIGCLGLVVIVLVCACLGLGGYFVANSGELFGNATPTSIALPATITPFAPSPTATQAQSQSSIITDMVMAKDVTGDTLDPVDITYAFPANQSIFHAVVTVKNAPQDTALAAVWFTEQGQRMGDYELKTQGSRNLDFTFKPDSGKLPPGNYRVEIRLNGTPYRSMNFTVLAQAASSSVSSSSSRASSASSTASSAQPKPSGLVASVTMATGTQGDNKDPVNPTTVFGPSATFHAVVRTNNAPANTKYGATWYAVDVGSAASPNTLIDQTELSTDGTRNIDFTLSPRTTWPAGTYRVEIYVNGVLDTVKTFTVSPSGAISASISSAASKPQSSSAVPVLTECGTIPSGQGGLLVINYYGQQMNYTIGGTLYKIDGNGRKAIFLTPGKQNYSANIPGVGEKQGSLDIVAGQCTTQSWASQ